MQIALVICAATAVHIPPSKARDSDFVGAAVGQAVGVGAKAIPGRKEGRRGKK